MRSLILALLTITIAAVLPAPAQTPTGNLRGIVLDATAARVANASIDAAAVATAQLRHTTSGTSGEFRLESLAPGLWRVTVAAPGFAPASSVVSVAVSSTEDLAVTLKPASVSQSVTTQSQPSSITAQTIDLASAVHQSVVTERDLANLPLPARSFANIAYLAPGTEPVEPSDPTKARITAVSTGGSSGLNNELSVDGGDNSDDFIGGFLQNFSPDSIEEFAIRTSQTDADTGNTTAGSIVITTKSGTNQLHGGAAFYERAADLNARYPIENPAETCTDGTCVHNPKQPFSRQNYVTTLGGPVIKEKLYFFAAFEAVHEDASIAYSPNSVAEFNALARLAAMGLVPDGVTSIAVPNNVPIPFRDEFGSLRFDYAQSPRSHSFLRASTDNYTTHNSLVQQGTLPSTGLLSHNNYLSLVVGNQFAFTPDLLGDFVFNASGLHLTQARNSTLGFALAFPFSSTAQTISGFETFGDNQFATPITYFPSIRNQEKYQLRYDLSYSHGRHAPKFGINFIHEPVLGGDFPSNTEKLYSLPLNPLDYIADPTQFTADLAANQSTSSLGGPFSQNIQRLAFYAQDSWRIRNLTLNYGMRYSTTFGLFNASGRSQTANPGYETLAALGIPLVGSAPHDDRKQFAPRLGIAYAPNGGKTVLRGGFGLYFADLAQGGWSTALEAVNQPAIGCTDPTSVPATTRGAPHLDSEMWVSRSPTILGAPFMRLHRMSGSSATAIPADSTGCIPGSSAGGTANLIDPHYRTPYAIHISGGAQHAFSATWSLSADFVHEQGNHGYRAYSYTGGVNLFTPQLSPDDPNQANFVPNVNVFHSDNRSSYNGLLVHLQGDVSHRFNLIANYTFSKAQTWGCVLGELFDYVNGVCDPLNAFGPGDYGPSGEDVRHRFVLAGTYHAPAGFEVSGLTQAESARPFTITTADNSGRVTVNGQPTALDAFRGTPYLQTDLRVSRPFIFAERYTVQPFAEMFNLFNRNNPGANFVTNAASIPGCAATGTDCTASSLKQLEIPAGGLGDFFGPGTTVGAPFAAQLGLRLTF